MSGVKTSNFETNKFSEPTLVERVAERVREQQSLAERLRREFGVDASSDDERNGELSTIFSWDGARSMRNVRIEVWEMLKRTL